MKAAVLVPFALVASAVPALAQDLTQTIPLRPGWNAISLEVQPASPDPADVFAGLPVVSVWRFVPGLGTAAFVTTPGFDDLSEGSGWLGWFPASSEQSVLTTLDEIRVNQAYLVSLSGAQAVDLVVTGPPSLAPIRWTPDGFTLTGFPVEADAVTFGQFFAGSGSHVDAEHPLLVYELMGSGAWEPILQPDLRRVAPGAAYWVHTRGGSGFQGPFEVTPPAGDGLDFGAALTTRSLRVRKRSAGAAPIDFALQAGEGATAVPLAYRTIGAVDFDTQGGTETACTLTWRAFAAPLTLPQPPCEPGDPDPPFAADQQVVLQLGVVRRDFGAADDTASILTVSDGSGVRRLVPVRASRVTP